MSALAIVPSGRTAAYGAEELKRAAHRYGFTALTISVLIHFSVIGLYYFIASLEDTQAVDRKPPRPPIIVDVPPSIPIGYTIPPKTGSGSRTRAPRGIPVPVAEDPTVPEKSIDSGPGTVEGPGPVGGDPMSGEYPPGEMPIDPDIAPPDWVPVEKEPVLVRSAVPQYPEVALKAGIEGKVWVKIWVDKQGKPREVDILRSDYEIFNEAAIEAARKFLFTPAYMNNGPVSVWVSVPFTFRIGGGR